MRSYGWNAAAKVISVDSRPSDALALACEWIVRSLWTTLCFKNSKLAAKHVGPVTTDELRKWLEGLNDDDLGKYKM